MLGKMSIMLKYAQSKYCYSLMSVYSKGTLADGVTNLGLVEQQGHFLRTLPRWATNMFLLIAHLGVTRERSVGATCNAHATRRAGLMNGGR